MPHIIIEYSHEINALILPILKNVHEALAKQGIPKEKIKTRGIPFPYTVVGNKGTEGNMLHASLLLLAGRDTQTRKQYGDAIMEQIKAGTPEDTIISMEIREMNPDTYYL